ncbi:MAG: hypothetical protein WCI55_10995 [Armatimonadota bacterium]
MTSSDAKPKPIGRILTSVALSGLLVASWFGYRAYTKPKTDIYEMDPETLRYLKGDLPLLPGPYLAEGDPKDLAFEKVDLGIAKFVSMSEQGDVLYQWFGNEPKESKIKDEDGFDRITYSLPAFIYRVRRANGTIQDFPEATAGKYDDFHDQNVRLTRGGKVIEIKKEDPSYAILCEGKTIVSGDEKNPDGTPYFSYWDSGTKITDDGMFPNSWPRASFIFDKNFQVHIGETTNQPHVPFESSSTELGTVGILRPDGLLSSLLKRRNQLAIFKNGAIKLTDVPEQLSQFSISPTKHSIYLFSGPYNPSKPYCYQDGKFSVVPTPNGVASLSGLSANSKGEMILSTSTINPLKLGKQNFPYNYENFYVSNGKSYQFQKLFKQIFKETPQLESETFHPIGEIDENGNFPANCRTNDFDHLFLLKRKR